MQKIRWLCWLRLWCLVAGLRINSRSTAGIVHEHAGPQDDTSIEMAFSKKKIEERKQWLSSFCPGTFLDNSGDTINYSDFINKVSH